MKIQSMQFETLHMIPYVKGFIENNTYVLWDEAADDCVVIDPSVRFGEVLSDLDEKGLKPSAFWLTHCHFDHYIGTGAEESLSRNLPTLAHPLDRILFENNGAYGSHLKQLDACPEPRFELFDAMKLSVGAYEFTVLHTPGHAPGHCCFYCERAGWLFSGDLVFFQSYGRTDLMGGSQEEIFRSIREKVLTLPESTIIFPGHNDFTTVADEKKLYA